MHGIARALRQADAAACEAAALQLCDIVTKSPADAQAAVCVAVASDSDLVEAAFVHALGRPGLSDAEQHALVTTVMMMLLHDDVKKASTAIMLAYPAYLLILLRIIAQEQPVAACRYHFHSHSRIHIHRKPCCFLKRIAVSKPFVQLCVFSSANAARPIYRRDPRACSRRRQPYRNGQQSMRSELLACDSNQRTCLCACGQRGRHLSPPSCATTRHCCVSVTGVSTCRLLIAWPCNTPCIYILPF